MSGSGKRIWVASALVIGLFGCTLVAPKHSTLEKTVGATNMKPDEIRTRVRDLAPRLSAELAAVADELSESSTDPALRRDLTHFKINAVSQLQFAMYQQDPIGALIDTWALLAQLEDRVPTIGFNEEQSAHALKRLTEMEAEVERVWYDIRKDEAAASAAKPKIHQWAKQNPLDQSVATRPSTVSLLANLTAASGLTLTAATGEVVEQVRDLNSRVDLLSSTMPKQARWEAEFLVRDLLADSTLLSGGEGREGTGGGGTEGQAENASVGETIQQVIATYQKFPALIDSERRATFDRIHQERVDTLLYLSDERARTASQIDGLVSRWTDHFYERQSQLVDRIFVRALVLLGLFLLGTAALILLRRTRERPRFPTPPARNERVRA